MRIGASLIASGVAILTSSSSAARARRPAPMVTALPTPMSCTARRLVIITRLPILFDCCKPAATDKVQQGRGTHDVAAGATTNLVRDYRGPGGKDRVRFPALVGIEAGGGPARQTAVASGSVPVASAACVLRDSRCAASSESVLEV